jgi:hypothetical protein
LPVRPLVARRFEQPSDSRSLVIAVILARLSSDLTTLSYDELFALHKAAVTSLRGAAPADATRIEQDIVVPLREEFTRRSRLRRKG